MQMRCAITGVLLFALVGAVVYLARPEPFVPGITWANAARIQPGMTEAEVVAVLGPQPIPFKFRVYEGDEPSTPSTARRKGIWGGAECDVGVYFDSAGLVVWTLVSGPPSPTWFGRFRRRLGL